MATIHVVSHTHWDREWYQTFQQFRLRLVRMLDKLLAILADDPEYRYFMLDGQTVVLEDYLDIRPEKAAELRAHIASGRVLIGPWRCLPDEFLVSPEAIIRNLLLGRRDCARFGGCMMIGYLPDTFGHIGQMPQILRGFGMSTACLWRGLDDEPCELWWEAPDGSRVLLAYLRDSYSNAMTFPASTPEKSAAVLTGLVASLLPHAPSGHVLIMHGTDHLEPHPRTAADLAYARQKMGHAIAHSTLPAYLDAVLNSVEEARLVPPTVRGELRSPKRQPLLPGVLSARMWIKQRNHACETLLERWSEPFTAWAASFPRNGEICLIDNPAPLIARAWRLLLECHPHDSICGCSIDQVHAEMASRFDQVEQIGEEITRQALQTLALRIDTRGATHTTGEGRPTALIVFNPAAGPRTELVQARVLLPLGAKGVEIRDAAGDIVAHRVLEMPEQSEVINVDLDRDGMRAMLEIAREGQIPGMRIFDVALEHAGDRLTIDIALCELQTDPGDVLEDMQDSIERYMADSGITRFHLRARLFSPALLHFIAREIPERGYAAYTVRPSDGLPECQCGEGARIENALFVLEADPRDGTLTLTDKRSGATYAGLNRFVDGGDCGDEYNYCPPATDRIVDACDCVQVLALRVERDTCMQALEVTLALPVPEGLQEDRRARTSATAALMITTRAVLVDGLERIDFTTTVENPARDHRLRVHFPVPVQVERAVYDGHFEVLERPIGLPAYDATWIEDPRPEVPQRAFTDVSDGQTGLMLANRGLPEVEVLRAGEGMEIALTLLRCVGWLSRDDFPARKGHAGPPLMATPAAQMPGVHSFAYALLPHAGTWRQCHPQADAFQAPLRAVATTVHAGHLPLSAAFLRVEPPEFVVSTVKIAENGSGIIIRGYNTSSADIDVTLTCLREFSSAMQCRIDETREAALPYDAHGGVRLQARGHAILTVRLE